MKIVIATGIFKPEPGGPSTLAYELGERLFAAGHTVTVITYSQKNFYDSDKEYSFKLIRIVRSNKLSNYFRYFLRLLREASRADFIYTLDWFSAGMPVLAVSILSGKPYVVRVGGGYIWEKYLSLGRPPVTLNEFYEKGLYKDFKVMYWIIKRVLKNARYVVFNSDIQKHLYEKYYNLNPRKTTTITNATPENKFGSLLKDYKTLGQQQHDKEIVFAGRFIKMKNVESVIRAFAKLKDLSYRLLLIGEGPTELELRKIVEELGLSHRVTFLPPMGLQELYRRIANCAYVITASWTDISPHQIYECMVQGIPFLLTKENYLTINNQDFLKIDPKSVNDIAEKMNWLLDDKNYKEFKESLLTLEYRHSWDEVIGEHMRLFRDMMK